MIDEVNERSAWFTTITFTDEDGLPVVPSIASYRIDDVPSGVEIRADTVINPLSTSVDTKWERADTLILDETHPYETRRMTITWIYGTDSPPSHGASEYLLNVVNLKGVTTPSPA